MNQATVEAGSLKPLMRAKEVRNALNLSDAEWKAWRRAGKLSPVVVRVGARPYYAGAQVERVIRELSEVGR